jgi:tetratricopeptide (TPR) repeat protein
MKFHRTWVFLILVCSAVLGADEWADAKRQYSLGNFQEAYALYQKIAAASTSSPETAQAWIYAAWTKYTMGDREGMRDAFRRALAVHPDASVDADLFNETFAGEFQGIRNELVPALLPEQMESVQAAIQSMSDQYLQGKYKECVQMADRVLAAGQRFRQVYKLQGDCWVAQNKIQEGYDAYTSAGRVPSFVAPSQQELTPEGKLKKARSLYRRGEIKQAQALLSQLAYGVSPSPEVYSLLGMVLLEQGMYFEAEKVLQQGLLLHSGDGPYYNLYGVAFYAQDKYAESVKLFQQATAQDRLFVAGQSNLAAAYAQLKEFNAAETYYRQAMALDPTNAALLNDYGRVLLFLGKYADASARLTEAVRFASDPVAAYYLRGLAYFYAGKYEEARADLNAYLKAHPDDIPALESYGMLMKSQDQCDRALEYLSRAESLPGRRALAQCRLRLGQASDAAAVLEALPQDNMAVLNDLAAVQTAGGEFRKAQATVDKIPAGRRVTYVLEACRTVESITAARDAFGLP